MPKISNRNGGRPRVPPEQHTVRRTVTIRPGDLAYLGTIDDNLSAAIRKLIAARPTRRTAKKKEQMK